jgi:hypothetical protein
MLFKILAAQPSKEHKIFSTVGAPAEFRFGHLGIDQTHYVSVSLLDDLSRRPCSLVNVVTEF